MEKLKGDSEEAKAAFQEKLRKQEQERIVREKKEKAAALKKIRAQVDEEKKARVENNAKKLVSEPIIVKREEKKDPVSKSTTLQKEEPKIVPKKEHTECLLQIRLVDGSVIKGSFKPEDTLFVVGQYICSQVKISMGEFYIVTPYPKKEYELVDWKSVRLIDAGLVPKGQITIHRKESRGVLVQGKSDYPTQQQDDDDDDDDGNPKPLPFPGMPGPIQPTLPIEPVDDDAIQRTTKLICRIWLISNEECPEGANIFVYRPVDWKFNEIVKDRRGMAFSDDNTLSETQSQDGVKKTQNGVWKLKNNGNEIVITVGGQTKTMEIATITDEVLVLS